MKFMKPLSLYQDLLKPRAAEQGRLLGLNVGKKLIGLAISGSEMKVAEPLCVLVRDKTDLGSLAVELQQRISKYSLSALVIGHPLIFEYSLHHLRDTKRAAEMRQFVKDLTETGKLEGVPYTFFDDCGCQTLAERAVKGWILDPVVAEQTISRFAAVSVLQEYLDWINPDLQ